MLSTRRPGRRRRPVRRMYCAIEMVAHKRAINARIEMAKRTCMSLAKDNKDGDAGPVHRFLLFFLLPLSIAKECFPRRIRRSWSGSDAATVEVDERLQGRPVLLKKSQKDVTSVVPSFACGSTIRCNTPYL